jgi:glycosyltransferase involved in cell wall biosynthesis
VKLLNIFNHYIERGGEAAAVVSITESLSHVAEVASCDFSSADWTGPNAPAAAKQALWMIRNPSSIRKVREQHFRSKADAWLVHNVFPVGSAAIYAEAKRLGVPIIQYLHNFRPFSVNGYLWADDRLAPEGLSQNYWPEIWHAAWQDSSTKTAWLALVLKLSRALGWWNSVKSWIAVSDFMRNKFISAGVPASDIFTLRHFWKPQLNPVSSEGDYYLYLGRLITAKGINVLLEAWQILERELGSAAPRLVIAGAGPLDELIAQRATKMLSTQFVGELLGHTKRKVIENARAVVVPSIWWEPLGLVVYEAYDFGKPVLAAASGGLPEIVVNNLTGVLHTPGNAQQLAHQVLELEKDVARRREMGQQARLWLKGNAGEEQWLENFAAITAHTLGPSA